MKNTPRTFFFFLALLPHFLFAQWQQTSGPEGGIIYCVERVGSEIWAGTEGGLYISSNNGVSWNLSPLVAAESAVTSIDVLPGEIFMVIAVYNPQWEQTEPVARRSTDGGVTWADLPIPWLGWTPELVAFYRDNSGKLFVRGEYYFYTSEDEGANWTEIILPDDAYANDWAMSGDKLVSTAAYVIYRSLDGGETWMDADSTGNYLEGVFLDNDLIIIGSSYDDSLRISQDFGNSWSNYFNPGANAKTTYRGDDGNLYSYGSHLFKSTDNGVTWISLMPSGIYYGTATDVVSNNSEFIFASNRGIYTTSNNGDTWALSNSGLRFSRIYQLQADAHQWLYANTFYYLYRSKNGGDSWEKLPIPNNFYPEQLIVAGDTIFIAGSSKVYKSFDQGATWSLLSSQYIYVDGLFEWHNGVLYMGKYNQYFSTADMGATFDTVKVENPLVQWGGAVDDLLFLDTYIFAALNGGEVLRTTDNGQTWTLLHTLFSPGASNGNKLVYTNNRLFVFGRLESGYSDDLGDTWTGLPGQGLPVDKWGDPLQINAVLATGNLLFATVPYNGVFMSSNSGQSWLTLNNGLGNLRGRSLAMADGVLFLGTSTGGVWRRGLQLASVTGTVYRDDNNNGQTDNGEPPIPGVIVAAQPLQSYNSTDQTGVYNLLAEALNDTIRAIPPSPYATVNPPFYIATQSAAGLNFGIHYTPDIKDLCITMTLLQPLRPGFDNELMITVKNVGTVATPANVHFEMPDMVTYQDANPSPVVNNNLLDWDLGVLTPFETVNLSIHLNAGLSLQLGDIVSFPASVLPLEDQNPDNNTTYLRTTVTGSYDPNDKQVLPEKITPEELLDGNRLTYTIRFQNTGTFYAEFITIRDSLSENLDVSTLEILSASHPCTWSVSGPGVVEFRFPDIFLEPAFFDELASQGFVKFSVKPKKGLALGEQVDNTAYIFFDYNPPIQTNTVNTLVSLTSGTQDVEKISGGLRVYPNPADRMVWIKAVGSMDEVTMGMVRIMDRSGKIVHSEKVMIQNEPFLMRLPELPAGNYTVEMMTVGGIYSTPLEVIRRK